MKPKSLQKRIAQVKNAIVARGKVMCTCLTEKEAEAFETRYNFKLPADYRRFLLEIGDGGEGPRSFGLLKLGDVPEHYPRSREHVLRNLHKPFPLTKYWTWEGAKEQNPELRETIHQGCIPFVYEGCCDYLVLVVSGRERGQVWSLTDVGIQPCAPRRDFLSWYEYWISGGFDWWADFSAKQD